MYAFGGSPGNFQAGQQYSAGLLYHYSGLLLTAAMYSGNPGGSAATIPIPSAIAFSGRNVGATYYFNNRLSVKAAYTLYKVAGSFDNRVISGGLAYKLTPFLSIDGGAWYTRDGNDSNNHSILGSLGVEYSLSRRTTPVIPPRGNLGRCGFSTAARVESTSVIRSAHTDARGNTTSVIVAINTAIRIWVK